MEETINTLRYVPSVPGIEILESDATMRTEERYRGCHGSLYVALRMLFSSYITV
jgi:hypothetical protein